MSNPASGSTLTPYRAIRTVLAPGILFFGLFSSLAHGQALSGCAQAHCSPNLSGQTGLRPPLPPTPTAVNRLASYQYSSYSGSSYGLGCSGNGSVVACSYALNASDPLTGSSVRLFNAQGTAIAVQSPFDGNAATSAPLVFSDGSVLEIDDHLVGYRPYSTGGVPTGDSVGAWITAAKPSTDLGLPVSPVMANATTVFVAEKCPSGTTPTTTPMPCGISTYKLNTSTNTLSYNGNFTPLRDAAGNYYETINTAAVDQSKTPARVYIVASALCAGGCAAKQPRQGYLFEVSVNTDGSFSTPVALFPFPGPSGSSPLLVSNYTYTKSGTQSTGNALFFDGTAHTANPTAANASTCDQRTTLDTTHALWSGCFYGVLDTSTSSAPSFQLMWARSFGPDGFQAAAAQDPRTGLWVFPLYTPVGNSSPTTNTCATGSPRSWDNCLVRLDYASGSTLQTIDMTTVLGPTVTNGYAYRPSSAVMTTTATDNAAVLRTYLTLASGPVLSSVAMPSKVATVDVTSTPVLSWVTGTNSTTNPDLPDSMEGQFVTVSFSDAQGTHFYDVFTGHSYGPFYYGY